jgi:hypothetical protein
MALHSADVTRFSWAALRGFPARTALMLLAMAIGVAAVVMLTALGEGARRYVTGEFSSLGTNLVMVFPGRSETHDDGRDPARPDPGRCPGPDPQPQRAPHCPHQCRLCRYQLAGAFARGRDPGFQPRAAGDTPLGGGAGEVPAGHRPGARHAGGRHRQQDPG